MRYSFSSKAVGKAARQFILSSISCIKENRLDLDVRELVQFTCTLCCVTAIKLIKDRKLLLLFPQFIKYKTFELLWNLDITFAKTQSSHFRGGGGGVRGNQFPTFNVESKFAKI